MTRIEIKTELEREIEYLSDANLENILQLVKKLHEQSELDEKIDFYFNKIMNENSGLLERLAK